MDLLSRIAILKFRGFFSKQCLEPVYTVYTIPGPESALYQTEVKARDCHSNDAATKATGSGE